ncbi:MAG: amidohydrolase family protein [Candidatus Hydrogenedentes bacterium]|nr:amidohydrolase family protein [Candidatus Hydrogenedentota bacterium]
MIHENGVVTLYGLPVGSGRPVQITIADGKIDAITQGGGYGRPDYGSRSSIIGPTLFDIQVNGGNGINLQGSKTKPEDVLALTRFLATWGVSKWIPTITTNSFKKMEHGCRVIAKALEDAEVARAVPGIHLEGPFLSPLDGPRGAHAKRYVRNPRLHDFDKLNKASGGHVLYTTVAPELPRAIPFIKGLVKRGVVVALGHHNATAEEIAEAVDAGARLCTHLGNGLATELDRHHNPLWPQLANDRLAAAMIADLHHLPPPVLKSMVRMKGPENVILTSDAVRLAGLKPGTYPHPSGVKGKMVELLPSGRINLCGTNLLSGSALMLLQGVLNATRETDMTLEQAFRSASEIPAEVLGVKADFGTLKPGVVANLIVFDLDQSHPQWKPLIRAAFVNGVQTV